MKDGLQDKVAIVSAAAGAGIGHAIARRFGVEGAEVIVSEAHERRSKEAASELSKVLGREVLSYKVDVRSRREIDDCVFAVLARHGRVDVLCNNAGINRLCDVWELTEEDWAFV